MPTVGSKKVKLKPWFETSLECLHIRLTTRVQFTPGCHSPAHIPHRAQMEKAPPGTGQGSFEDSSRLCLACSMKLPALQATLVAVHKATPSKVGFVFVIFVQHML